MDRKKILVAASPEGQYRALQALSEKYDLQFASTLREAQQLLAEPELHPQGGSRFSMVIAGIHFNDSRMFQLLQYVRSVDHFDKLPFLVMQARPTSIDDMGASRKTAEMLGAFGFVQLQTLPEEEANKLLLDTVELGFGRSVEYERVDQKQEE
jgi:hypothetical protein